MQVNVQIPQKQLVFLLSFTQNQLNLNVLCNLIIFNFQLNMKFEKLTSLFLPAVFTITSIMFDADPGGHSYPTWERPPRVMPFENSLVL